MISEWESLHCSQDEIYIVENPSVFAVLCGKKKNTKQRAYVADERTAETGRADGVGSICKVGNRVYYAGDLDPEGILIAQKLSQYYKGEFHYWHMETADYEVQVRGSDIAEAYEDTGADYGWRLKPVVDRIGRVWDCRVSGDVGGGDVIMPKEQIKS